ncbi:MAG: amidohydrolase [Hyphomicrobiales bacterium]|nr:amidohydrolase [Hyphomicrobiales bacterium]
MSLFDVHGHCMPEAYRSAILDSPVGKTARIPHWDFAEHIALLDRHDIAVCVLSLAPPGIYFGDAGKTRVAARRCNEALAEIVRRGGGRFRALAVLPLPSVEDACAEVAHALDVLKLDGIGLFTSYQGEFLGQASFDPVMAELDARGAIAFVHPNIHPANQMIKLPWPAFVIEYPFDTTRAATNLIFSGALDRFSAIRFVLAHGGGTLPYLAYRLAMVGSQQLAHPEFTERFPLPFFTQNAEATDPAFLLARVRRFWFEVALSAGAGTIATLETVADPDRILLGTDWPYAPETILTDTVAQLTANESLTPDKRRAIVSGNARKLFG